MIVALKDNGRQIVLKLREKLDVRLPESQVSGYLWQYKEGCPLLSLEDSEYKGEGEARFTGMGARSWYFKACATGECKLQFDLVRPWSGPSTEFSVIILVR